jgi:hypothetical protein
MKTKSFGILGGIGGVLAWDCPFGQGLGRQRFRSWEHLGGSLGGPPSDRVIWRSGDRVIWTGSSTQHSALSTQHSANHGHLLEDDGKLGDSLVFRSTWEEVKGGWGKSGDLDREIAGIARNRRNRAIRGGHRRSMTRSSSVSLRVLCGKWVLAVRLWSILGVNPGQAGRATAMAQIMRCLGPIRSGVRKWRVGRLRPGIYYVQVIATREDREDQTDAGRDSGVHGGWREQTGLT